MYSHEAAKLLAITPSGLGWAIASPCRPRLLFINAGTDLPMKHLACQIFHHQVCHAKVSPLRRLFLNECQMSRDQCLQSSVHVRWTIIQYLLRLARYGSKPFDRQLKDHRCCTGENDHHIWFPTCASSRILRRTPTAVPYRVILSGIKDAVQNLC